MVDCVFCAIVAGDLPADIIYQDEHVLALLPKEIEAYGHTLVIPKQHYQDLLDISEEMLAQVMFAIQKLSLHYQKKLGATGFNLFHASGKDAQQSVFHFHFHLIPRFPEDGLNTWPNFSPFEVDRKMLWEKLHIG